MSDQGFSIPEVMVALFVLAVGGIALAQSNSVHVAGLKHAEQTALAAIVAENRMVDAVLAESGAADAVNSGRAIQGKIEFEWVERRAPGPIEGLTIIEVSVRRRGQADPAYRLQSAIRTRS